MSFSHTQNLHQQTETHVTGADAKDMSIWLTHLTRELMLYDDTYTILDRILLEARKLCKADAGTVYLMEKDLLTFAYTHNDTLFPVNTAYKYAYANATLPLTDSSIAGYCALHYEIVNLPDVRKPPEGVPFHFNDGFDRSTGYTTVSMLTVPLIGRKNTLRGVLQLINSMEAGKPCPFTPSMETRLELLAVQAVNALERSLLLQDMLLGMQAMAAFNDPLETGAHAMRVGAIAAEIYQHWAEKTGVPVDMRRLFRAELRLAAALHDLGKVAIPREILKKPGKLTEEEFRIIQRHCAEGARLLQGIHKEEDNIARSIILHHHQKWNGTGYTGDPEHPALSGTDIPLAARITAVADVFDALVSPRCYKRAWSWDEAVTILRRDAGSHFDPELIDSFLAIQELVQHIFTRFPEVAPSVGVPATLSQSIPGSLS